MFGVWGVLGSVRHLLPVLVAEGNVVATKPGRPSLYVHGARPEKAVAAAAGSSSKRCQRPMILIMITVKIMRLVMMMSMMQMLETVVMRKTMLQILSMTTDHDDGTSEG